MVHLCRREREQEGKNTARREKEREVWGGSSEGGGLVGFECF